MAIILTVLFGAASTLWFSCNSQNLQSANSQKPKSEVREAGAVTLDGPQGADGVDGADGAEGADGNATTSEGADGSEGGGQDGGSTSDDPQSDGSGGEDAGADGGPGSEIIITEDSEVWASAKIASHLVNLFSSCYKLFINGDGSSTEAVSGCSNTTLTVNHDFYSAKTIALTPGVIFGQAFESHGDSPLPIDINGDNIPDFPEFDTAKLKAELKGSVASQTQNVSSWHSETVDGQAISGSLFRELTILVGSLEKPIKINSDVLIGGDLIIKGYYQGAGTIHVEGDVYIPSDLRPLNSAFPFNRDPTLAADQGKEKILEKTDALSIMAKGTIYAGDSSGAYPTGIASYGKYQRYYEPIYDCVSGTTSTPPSHSDCDCYTHKGGISLLEANLYARTAIRINHAQGTVQNSVAVNGTVITEDLNMLVKGPSGQCKVMNHPVHKYPMTNSYVNFDYRFMHNLRGFSSIKHLYVRP